MTHEERVKLIQAPVSINVIKGGKSYGGVTLAHEKNPVIRSIRRDGYSGLGDGSRLPDMDWRDE